MIIEMPKEFHLPAKGTINYQNILVKVNFPEDKWVVAAEMRAGNPKVVHHMRAIVQQQAELLLGERDVHDGERDRVEGEIPRREPRVLPLVWHGDYVVRDQVPPVFVPQA